MTDTQGNNEPGVLDQQQVMAKLEAEAKALTDQIIANSGGKVATPETQTQKVEPASTTSEQKPPEANQVEVPPQFKDKDGAPSLAKIEQSSEHLLKKNEEIKAALAKYKDLQKGFTQGTQELKKVEKAQTVEHPAVAPEPVTGLPPAPSPSDYSLDFKQRIAQDLEKDPVETLLKLNAAMVKKALDDQRADIERRQHEESKMKDLDTVTQDEKNAWMLTNEGVDKVNRVFQEKPYLWQSKTPYQDALRFVDDVPGKVTNTSPMRTGNTPILGGGAFVPPSNPTPTASVVDELNSLHRQFDEALANRDEATMRKLSPMLDKLSARAFLG